MALKSNNIKYLGIFAPPFLSFIRKLWPKRFHKIDPRAPSRPSTPTRASSGCPRDTEGKVSEGNPFNRGRARFDENGGKTGFDESGANWGSMKMVENGVRRKWRENRIRCKWRKLRFDENGGKTGFYGKGWNFKWISVQFYPVYVLKI
jgi:hypothetical protein